MNPQIKRLDFKGQNIYVGIDVHLKSWSVEVLSQSPVLKKFSQSPSPEALHSFLPTNYPGADYHSVYEAGFCGFWIDKRLKALGINNLVVNPADVPTMGKEKLRKTDAVDCSKLARGLRNGDLRGIYVPATATLELRSLINILKEKIDDERFIRLIRKFLSAGYLENWKFHRTYSGTPQGGIISPILAAIEDKKNRILMITFT